MDKATRKLEEFKHISSAILEIDKRILQILTASTAVAVALLSAIAGLALGKEGVTVTVIHAYAALAPNLLMIPSFHLMLSQRIDMMRLGSYRRVFFEEQDKLEGWETRLERFRALKKMESNDPVPYIVWTIFIASGALFIFGVFKSGAMLCHLLGLILPAVLIVWPHYKWSHVVSVELPRQVKLWRKVASTKSTK